MQIKVTNKRSEILINEEDDFLPEPIFSIPKQDIKSVRNRKRKIKNNENNTSPIRKSQYDTEFQDNPRKRFKNFR